MSCPHGHPTWFTCSRCARDILAELGAIDRDAEAHRAAMSILSMAASARAIPEIENKLDTAGTALQIAFREGVEAGRNGCRIGACLDDPALAARFKGWEVGDRARRAELA